VARFTIHPKRVSRSIAGSGSGMTGDAVPLQELGMFRVGNCHAWLLAQQVSDLAAPMRPEKVVGMDVRVAAQPRTKGAGP
jgi:hypothetical protein